MDTFFEQIITIKKTAKNIAGIISIWLLALILCLLLFLFAGSFAFLLILGTLYGAFKLTCLFNVEYEYIVTNGTMDIDKIFNRASRKRISSFDLSIVSRLERFNPAQISNINQKDIVFSCNRDDSNAYLMVYQKEGKNPVYVVFAPNDKMKNAITKFLPKFIANSAFK